MINIKNSSVLKNGISAPVGGFANHVRWLALLDPIFQFELTPLAEPRFKKISDPLRHISFLDTNSKIDSFRTQIYPVTRSWDNWLWMEFLYREDLNNIFVFSHATDNDNVKKNLVLTIDPELALHCYFKFNSNLNHSIPEMFKKQIHEFTKNAVDNLFNHVENKILNVDCLYQPILDKTFYNNMIEWYELSDCYELANQVHELWFNSHQKAKQQFLEYTNHLYNAPY